MSQGKQEPNLKNASIDELRKEAHRRDWRHRLNATKELGDRGPKAKAAVQDLVELLADKNETVLGTAIIALSKIKPSTQNIIQPLLRLVLDKSESISKMANFAIIKLVPHNEHLIPALINALNHAKLFDRCRMMELIADIGPKANAAYPDLFQFIQGELSEDFAFNYALDALNKIGLPKASDLNKLFDLLKDPMGRLHLFVLPTFDKHNTIILNHVLPLFEETTEKIYYIHYQLITLIASSQIGASELIQPLIQCLAHSEKMVRRYSAECFAFIGPPAYEAIPALVQALKDNYLEVRYYAAEALGYIGATAYHAIPALTEASHDDDAAVRDSAKEAIDKIHGHSTN